MFTLNVRRRLEGAADDHGNATIAYASPTPWMVRGLAPGASTEPNQPNREAVTIAWSVYADSTDDIPGERDRVSVMGEDFEVVGRPQDFTKGPWPHPTAGVVVELARWEG